MIDVPRFTAALLTWLGVPFHYQGRTRAGTDCAGLVLAALAEQGVALQAPGDYHTSAAGALLPAELERCPLLCQRPAHEAAQPGDLLLFSIRRQPQHLAVALEAGRMIHATPTAGVRAVTLSPLWGSRLAAVYGWCDG